MTSAANALGARIDALVARDGANVIETVQAVTVAKLSAEAAREIHVMASRMGWGCDIKDAADEVADPEDLVPEMGPFISIVRKPASADGRLIVTHDGFIQALLGPDDPGAWQVVFATSTFNTGLNSVGPEGHADVFSPSTELKSPAELVREGGEVRFAPRDIRKWLARGKIDAERWNDAAFRVFAKLSSIHLIRSLATEIDGASKIAFAGPPRHVCPVDPAQIEADLGKDGYVQLHAAASWVYEDVPATEQRHALFASELARSSVRGTTIGTTFAAYGGEILSGARLAYRMSQSELTRDAIKAQSDLRKAIADDTTKTVDGTRTLTTAVAVSIATAITLVAARAAGNLSPLILAVISVVVGAYLVSIAVSGWHHLHLQKALRDQWRQRFYQFVPPEDYEAMVEQPASKAAAPYHVMAKIALIIAACMFVVSASSFHSFLSANRATTSSISVEPGNVPSDEATDPSMKLEPRTLPSVEDATSN